MDLVYENSLPEVTLGGSGHPTTYSTTFEHGIRSATVDKALLEVGARSATMEIPRWKVLFNGVVVTREFKPSICARMGDGFFCKLVFDVTPIVNSKRRKDHTVGIEYMGVREFVVDHVGLLLMGSYDTVRSFYHFWSGAISLKPGDVIELSLPGRLSGMKARIVAYIPHTSASLVVSTGEGTSTISKSVGTNEFALDIGDAVQLRLEHKGTGEYYPRELLVSSILVYRIEAPEPRIEASYSVSADALKLEVSNAGDDRAENLVVTVFAVGNVVDRAVVGELKPGESKTLNLRLKPGSTNTVRVIWRHRGKLMFRDIRLRPD
ncbi:hypothetical protein CF15_06250 [Pyrodictium occultum]|uniref:CARDB domain-containing protein n=2 Tax=Pyrodictium occultum TaxID=2309 RepID=A0A0V8RWG7_PYROC|nr:hypothetical protein CF15_06250 [Pyrodictium occultum]